VSCYLDPRFEIIDRRAIFHRSWQYICHIEKIRESGQYVTTHLFGKSIVVVRGDDGVLRAFYNVCRHRAHELLSGEGQVQKIICPYHAWTYHLNGTLDRAPRSSQIEEFDPRKICLNHIRVEIFCGLVFVNLDSHAESLASQSGNLAHEINEYAPDIDQLTFAHRLTYHVEANWKTVADNFLECNHCPVAHKDFCSLIDMDTYQVNTHGIYSSHMAKAGLTPNRAYDVTNASVTDHAVWFLWPNTTLMRYPGRGNFMVWRFVPDGPEKTYEEFDFFFETADPNKAEQEAIRFVDKVLQVEDIGLVESVQRGMRSGDFNSGRYMVDPNFSGLGEHAVHHFHGLVLNAYSKVVDL
jgi:choline monooxygenase